MAFNCREWLPRGFFGVSPAYPFTCCMRSGSYTCLQQAMPLMQSTVAVLDAHFG